MDKKRTAGLLILDIGS